MVESITLRNFKSFGIEQRVPLQPLTVLVGPNNSGKSNLLSLGRFIPNLCGIEMPLDTAVAVENQSSSLVHRPPLANSAVGIGWQGPAGAYTTEFSLSPTGGPKAVAEQLGKAISSKDDPPFHLLITADEALGRAPIVDPLREARYVKLSLPALREDSPPTAEDKLSSDGAMLAQTLLRWRGREPEKAEALDAFVRQCLPEVRNVLVGDGADRGAHRLLIRQSDGQQFDAKVTSDGVLCLCAFAMHAVDAPPGAVLFLEEPEQSLHPALIEKIVDLLRRAVTELHCQVVMATHSRVVVDQFRDVPESILLFRRSDQGTLVRAMSDFPVLVDGLSRALPGDMLEEGFFNLDFEKLAAGSTANSAP